MINDGGVEQDQVRLRATLYKREDPYLFQALVVLDPIKRAQRHRFLVRHGLIHAATALLPLLKQPPGAPVFTQPAVLVTDSAQNDCVRLDLRTCWHEDPHVCMAFNALAKNHRPQFHRFLLRQGFLFADHAPSITPQLFPLAPVSMQPAELDDESPELVANTAGLSGEVDF